MRKPKKSASILSYGDRSFQPPEQPQPAADKNQTEQCPKTVFGAASLKDEIENDEKEPMKSQLFEGGYGSYSDPLIGSDQRKMMRVRPTYAQSGHHHHHHPHHQSNNLNNRWSSSDLSDSKSEPILLSYINNNSNSMKMEQSTNDNNQHQKQERGFDTVLGCPTESLLMRSHPRISPRGASILFQRKESSDQTDDPSTSDQTLHDNEVVLANKDGVLRFDSNENEVIDESHVEGEEDRQQQQQQQQAERQQQHKKQGKVKDSEGGYGWVVVASSAMVMILVDGMMLSTGSVFQDPWQKAFKASASQASLPISIMIGTSHITGPIATICVKKIKFRITSLAGFAFMTAGLMMATMCNNLWALCVSLGMIAGFGVGLAYFSAFIIVNQFFKRKRALACGIVVSGSGAGTLIFSIVEARLVELYAWRNALFILSAMIALGFMPAVLFANDRIPSWSSYWMQKAAIFDKDLLKSPVFLFVCITRTFTFIGFYINYIFLPQHVLRIGATNKESMALALIAIGGVTNILGRIAFGWLADQPWVNTVYMFNGVMVVGGIIVTLTPLYPPSYIFFVFYALVFGLMCACFASTDGPILIAYVGSRRVSASFGIYIVTQGITPFIGGPATGALFDLTGDFNLAYYVMGSVIVIGGCSGFLLPMINRWEQRNCPRSVTASAASLPHLPHFKASTTPCAAAGQMPTISVDEMLNATPASHVFTQNQTEKKMQEEVDRIRLVLPSLPAVLSDSNSSGDGSPEYERISPSRSTPRPPIGNLDTID